ncbi:MAG: hypothetical protein KDD44_08400, partial [Bdellovibrionales bacterium]|nr:hypothetical protein [Bdellovibrionales bacterium]
HIFSLQEFVVQYEHKRNTDMTMTEPQIDPGMAEDLKDRQRENRGDQTPDFDLPEADQAPDSTAPAEMTTADQADIARLEAAPEALEPTVAAPSTDRVTDPNILDLREERRAKATANAQSRLATLQAMEAAGEPVVTAEALDRQAARDAGTNTEAPQQAPAGEKQSWFKRLLGRS